jgi:hypothetical protein
VNPHLRLKETVLAGLTDGGLKPRYHNGVGFAQVYITDDVRLHFWHPDFPSEPEAFGNRHNHRFDMESHVLMGAVTNIRLEPLWLGLGDGGFDVYAVQPAHLGAAVPVLDERGVGLEISDIEVIRAGQSYTFPKRAYHESRGHGVTVTVMKKSNQESAFAGIIALRGQTPEHGMHRVTISDECLRRKLIEIIDMLPEQAWGTIHELMFEATP